MTTIEKKLLGLIANFATKPVTETTTFSSLDDVSNIEDGAQYIGSSLPKLPELSSSLEKAANIFATKKPEKNEEYFPEIDNLLIVSDYYKTKFKKLYNEAELISDDAILKFAPLFSQVESELEMFESGAPYDNEYIAAKYKFLETCVYLFKSLEESSLDHLLGKYQSSIDIWTPHYDSEDLLTTLDTKFDAAISTWDTETIENIAEEYAILSQFAFTSEIKNNLLEYLKSMSHPEVQAGHFQLKLEYTDGKDIFSNVSVEHLNSAPLQKHIMKWLKNNPNIEKKLVQDALDWISTHYEKEYLYGIGVEGDPFDFLETKNKEWLTKIVELYAFTKDIVKPPYKLSVEIRSNIEPLLEQLKWDKENIELMKSIPESQKEIIFPDSPLTQEIKAQLISLNDDFQKLSKLLEEQDPLIAALTLFGREQDLEELTDESFQNIIITESSVDAVLSAIRSFTGGPKTAYDFGGEVEYYVNTDYVGCTDQCSDGTPGTLSKWEPGIISPLLDHLNSMEEDYPGQWLEQSTGTIFRGNLLKLKYAAAVALVNSMKEGKLTDAEWKEGILAIAHINYLEKSSPSNISVEDIINITEGKNVNFIPKQIDTNSLAKSIADEVKVLISIKKELKEVGHGDWTFNFFAGDYYISTETVDKLINEYLELLKYSKSNPSKTLSKFYQLLNSPLSNTVKMRHKEMHEYEFYRHMGIGSITTLATLPIALSVGAGVELLLGKYASTWWGGLLTTTSEGASFVFGGSILDSIMLDEPMFPGNSILENTWFYTENIIINSAGLKLFKTTSKFAGKQLNKFAFNMTKKKSGIIKATTDLTMEDFALISKEMPKLIKSLGFGIVSSSVKIAEQFATFTAFDYLVGNYFYLKEGEFMAPLLALIDTLDPNAIEQRTVTILSLIAGGLISKPLVKPLHQKVLAARLGNKLPQYLKDCGPINDAKTKFDAIIEKAIKEKSIPKELAETSKELKDAADLYLKVIENLYKEFPDLVNYAHVELSKKIVGNIHSLAQFEGIIGKGNSFGINLFGIQGEPALIFTYDFSKTSELYQKLTECFGSKFVTQHENGKIIAQFGNSTMLFYIDSAILAKKEHPEFSKLLDKFISNQTLAPIEKEYKAALRANFWKMKISSATSLKELKSFINLMEFQELFSEQQGMFLSKQSLNDIITNGDNGSLNKLPLSLGIQSKVKELKAAYPKKTDSVIQVDFNPANKDSQHITLLPNNKYLKLYNVKTKLIKDITDYLNIILADQAFKDAAVSQCRSGINKLFSLEINANELHLLFQTLIPANLGKTNAELFKIKFAGKDFESAKKMMADNLYKKVFKATDAVIKINPNIYDQYTKLKHNAFFKFAVKEIAKEMKKVKYHFEDIDEVKKAFEKVILSTDIPSKEKNEIIKKVIDVLDGQWWVHIEEIPEKLVSKDKKSISNIREYLMNAMIDLMNQWQKDFPTFLNEFKAFSKAEKNWPDDIWVNFVGMQTLIKKEIGISLDSKRSKLFDSKIIEISKKYFDFKTNSSSENSELNIYQAKKHIKASIFKTDGPESLAFWKNSSLEERTFAIKCLFEDINDLPYLDSNSPALKLFMENVGAYGSYLETGMFIIIGTSGATLKLSLGKMGSVAPEEMAYNKYNKKSYSKIFGVSHTHPQDFEASENTIDVLPSFIKGNNNSHSGDVVAVLNSAKQYRVMEEKFLADGNKIADNLFFNNNSFWHTVFFQKGLSIIEYKDEQITGGKKKMTIYYSFYKPEYKNDNGYEISINHLSEFGKIFGVEMEFIELQPTEIKEKYKFWYFPQK